jgi:hypothetical protein
MDRVYHQGIAPAKDSPGESPFTIVSWHPIQQIVKKASPQRIAYEKFNKQKHLCVMLSLKEKAVKECFNRLVELSDADISPSDRETLYQVFMSGQAQGERE